MRFEAASLEAAERDAETRFLISPDHYREAITDRHISITETEMPQ
ncbi:hypothetical protein [Kribbella deserti]|uniref:DUF5753 domain-containing protein n=1 Tax=Kribbella deserti TaxID=1926257 RepID=A0ABV6QDY9_9ACTN